MINVLYVFDDNYAPFAGISILSLLENNRDSQICVFCVGMHVTSDNTDKINHTVRHYGQKIVWIDSRHSIEYINSCNTGEWNGSKATWMKIFCLWDLPEEIDKILYIDSDTLISQDISEIFNTVIDTHPVAMVLDSLGNTNGNRNFGLKEYYNAGIILFNLKYWRNISFKTDFTEYFLCNADRYLDNEQGLINDYLRDTILRLPLEYNMQGFLMLFSEDIYLSVYNDFPFYTVNEIRNAKNSPVIIHFFRIFGDYPWEKGARHPFRQLYKEWKAKSLWADMPDRRPRNRGIVFKVERVMFRLFPQRLYLVLYRKIVERNY